MPSTGTGNAVPEAAQTASPITRLPDPLLRLILRHLASIYPVGSRRRPYDPAGLQVSLGWLALTHTCRRLRNVALDPESASLWGSSICGLPRALPVLSERARDAPLSVNLEPDGWARWEDQSQALLAVVKDNAPKLDRISLLLPSFSTPDPNDWRRRDDGPQRAECCTRIHAAILDALSGKELPNLQYLDLSYTPDTFIASSPLATSIPFIAPNLISLRLSRQRLSADHLYDILRGSPLLQSLSVEWIPSESPSLIALPLSNAGASLHMPHLVDLSLSAHDFASVLAIWKILLPNKDVRASFKASTQETRDFQSALTALSPLVYRQGLHALSLSTAADTFTFSVLPKRAHSHASSLTVEASRTPDSTTTPSDLLDTFLRFIDASWMDSLHLDVLSLSNPALSILSMFDTIVEMSCPFSSQSILSQLATTPNEDPIFPSMGTLTLTDSEGEGKEKWDVVARFLKSRAAQGVEVDCVRFTGRKGTERSSGTDMNGDGDVEGMKVLRGLVSEVIDERQG